MRRRSVIAGAAALMSGLAGSPAVRAANLPGVDVRLGRQRLHIVANGPAGVLLHPTIAGLDANMRSFAQSIAAAGLTAVVWDPYDGEDVGPDQGVQLARSKRLNDDQVLADLNRIVDHMVGPMALKAVGSVGWCLGGRTALLHAGADARVTAVSAYNPTIYAASPVKVMGVMMSKAEFPGQTLDEFAFARRIHGPVQVCRPGHDLAQPAEYAALIEALFSRTYPTLYEYYPDAGHGFAYKRDTAANIAAYEAAWPATLRLFLRALDQRKA